MIGHSNWISTRATSFRALRVAAAVFVACVASVAVAWARDLPPAPATFVYDEAGWLSPSVESLLSARLLAFERETSNQIVVAIFRELGDEDLADFSQRVAEAWGIGRDTRDNGILLAIFADDRLIDIEVGYGLEPVVTDAIAEQIRRTILVPALRRGDREQGVRDATIALMDASRGEFEGDGVTGSNGNGSGRIVFLLLVLVIVILIVRRFPGDGGGLVLGPPDFGDGGRSLPRWRIGSGGFGGGFGGGGGGGFRGGGGGFGGGGARGGW
jgi:uncharacterized protein